MTTTTWTTARTAYFNTAAFSAPAAGADRKCRRNVLRQPGIAQLDMGIFKNFQLTERFSVKFKWEVFNVLNHAMFATADSLPRLPAVLSGNFSPRLMSDWA